MGRTICVIGWLLLFVFDISASAEEEMLVTSSTRLYSMTGRTYRKLSKGARVRVIERSEKKCLVEYRVRKRTGTRILRGWISTSKLKPVTPRRSGATAESRSNMSQAKGGADVNITLALEQWGAIFEDIVGSHPPLVGKECVGEWPVVKRLQRVSKSRAFAAAVANGVDAELQRLSVGSLLASGLFGKRRGLACVEAYLADNDPVRRAAAAVALSYTGDGRASPKLAELLEDSDERVLCCRAIALKTLGSDKAVYPVALRYAEVMKLTPEGMMKYGEDELGFEKDYLRRPSPAIIETIQWLVPDDEQRIQIVRRITREVQRKEDEKWRRRGSLLGKTPVPWELVPTSAEAPIEIPLIHLKDMYEPAPPSVQQRVRLYFRRVLEDSLGRWQQIEESVRALAEFDNADDAARLCQRLEDGDESVLQRLVRLRLEALPVVLERLKGSRGTLPMGLIKFLCGMSDEPVACQALLNLLHTLPPIGKRPLSRSERRKLSDLYANVAHLYAQTGRVELFLAAIDLIEKKALPLIGKELNLDRARYFLSEKVTAPFIKANVSHDVLVKLLQEDVSLALKLATAGALVNLDSLTSLSFLARLCEDAALPLDFRLACAGAVARCGDPRAAAPALSGLTLGPNYSRPSVDILKEVGEQVGVAWDKRASRHPGQWLAAVKNSANTCPFDQTKIPFYILQTRLSFDVMQRALKDPSLPKRGREKLIKWFTYLPSDPRVTETLVQAAMSFESRTLRQEAIRSLAARRTSLAISALVKLMESEEKDVRAAAARALTNLPRIPTDSHVIEHLARWVRALKSSQKKQRMVATTHSIALAAEILSKHENWQAVPLLIEAVQKMSSERAAVANALGQMTGAKIGDFPDLWFELWLKCKSRYPDLLSLHQVSAPAVPLPSVGNRPATNPIGLDELLQALDH